MQQLYRFIPQLFSALFLVFSGLAYGQSPVAGFTVASNQGCAPFSVNFTNTSTGAQSYQWNFGNGNFSTLVNPQNVFIAPGTYTVTLTATAQGGATSTFSADITAMPGPTPAFSVNDNEGCEDQTAFSFTNSSIGATSHFWDFGDGTSSLSTNPTKIYNTPGNYSVSLLATNAVGCQSVYTLNQNIQINPVPTAAFQISALSVCAPGTPFQFTNQSIGASSYLWNFGDGTTSTAANPSKSYANPGTYVVSLVAGNASGCYDTLTYSNSLLVRTPIQPQFYANDSSGCIPFSSTISAVNVPGASYLWNFGNGQQSQAGSFVANYPTAGVYDVSLQITTSGGCVYSTTVNDFIQAYPKPTASFTVQNATGCSPLTVGLDNLSLGATSYAWQFSEGANSTLFEPSHTYFGNGPQWVRLTATNQYGCTHQQTINTISVTGPNAAFTASDTAGCPPFNVQFTNQSTGASSYFWSFGNGASSTQANPSVSVGQLGVYDVMLVALNGAGCRDTLIVEDYLHVQYEEVPYNAPEPVYACAPFTASFNLENTSASSYLWNFGDGTTSTSPNPSHVYTEPGDYIVSLVLNTGGACMQSYTVYQEVHIEGVVPVFTTTYGACPPFPVTFHVDTTNVASYLWDFGDGTTSTEAIPTHTYPNNNVHHVSLNVETELGCTYSYVGFNSVNFASMQANFISYYDPEDEFPVAVSFQSLNPNATGWLWNFGDGSTSTDENPVHIYQVDGDYQVSLTITTAECTVTSSGSAFADEAIAENQESASGGSSGGGAAVQVEPMIVCAPATIYFFRQDTTHQVISWNLGDGTTSSETMPIHQYTEPGIYNVFYIANTPYGVDTFSYPQTILVGGGTPNFSVNAIEACDYAEITVAVSNLGMVDNLTWTFGDGFTSNAPSLTHQLEHINSSYLVQLEYEDTLGCVSNSMESVLPSTNLPTITYPAAVCNDTIHFVNNFASYPGYTFTWDFGDGTTSNAPSPYHYYAVEGVYQVSLTYTTSQGCENSLTLPSAITFANPVPAYNTDADFEGCAPHTFSMANISPNVSQVAWFYSDGSWGLAAWNGSQYVNPVNKTFAQPGVYGFAQRVTSSLVPGCTVQTNFDSVITVHGADASFTVNQSGICIPIQASFNPNSTDAISWNWNFGNGITSNLENPVIDFVTEPADSFSLSITTIHGCVDSTTQAGLNLLDPQIEASYTGFCNPLHVEFSGSSDGMIDWEWDFGDGNTASGQSVSHVYTQDGNYLATLIVTTADNCRDTVTMEVPILVNGPNAGFTSPTPAGCAPSVVEFFDASQEAVSWLWDFGDNSSSTEQNPVKLYDQPGVYDVSLMVTAASGCTDTLLMNDFVTVLGPGTSFSVSAQHNCIGANVQFTDLSNGSVEWEWNFGEGSTSTEQNPSFTYADTGSYVVTLFSSDTLGCSAFYTIPLPIEIHPFPVAAFTPDVMAACAPMTVNFDNQSSGASTYSWTFGNQANSVQENPSFTFQQAGTYAVGMIASTEFGCKDTVVINNFEALLVPVAQFTLDHAEGCTPLSVGFMNASYNTEAPSYTWNFGNGTQSADLNPNTVYFNPGFYSVSLEVQNANGCADTLLIPQLVQVFDTLPAPATPILRVTVASGQSVTIDWEESTAPDFGAYELYQRIQGAETWEMIATIADPHTITFTSQGLNTFDNVYCYRLVTRDRCGYTVNIDDLVIHCTINIETSTASNNTVDVFWTPYVGKMPQQYRVYRAQQDGSLVTDLGTVPGDSTHFNDNSVYCPEPYRYFVIAEALNGQLHVESSSDYDHSAPIQNLFANQKVDLTRSTVVDDRSILTEWTVPQIMGQRVNGYKLYRSIDNVNFELIASLPEYQLEYLDLQVDVHKQKYYYAVMATNSCNLTGIEGQTSENIVLNVEAQDDLHFRLDWTSYESWGAHGVGFYMIERQNDEGDWEVVKSVGGNVTTAVDEN
jgi:PKD repeat protein